MISKKIFLSFPVILMKADCSNENESSGISFTFPVKNAKGQFMGTVASLVMQDNSRRRGKALSSQAASVMCLAWLWSFSSVFLCDDCVKMPGSEASPLGLDTHTDTRL